MTDEDTMNVIRLGKHDSAATDLVHFWLNLLTGRKNILMENLYKIKIKSINAEFHNFIVAHDKTKK